MSEWLLKATKQFERDMKHMDKRYPRETAQMRSNLKHYLDVLSTHDNPLLLVQIPFVHREASGCHAITQQPLSSAAQTRLYVYCYIQDHEVYLICAGDKQTQPKDNKFCMQFVAQF